MVMFLFVQITFTVLVRGAMGSTTVGMDYSIYWMAGRAVLIEGANPYSDEMALQNQLRVLQRPPVRMRIRWHSPTRRTVCCCPCQPSG
jgi:hypothetical protein